jgi:hypothetical protein
MSMRSPVMMAGLAALVLTPVPALARDSDAERLPERGLSEVSGKLSDPAMQIAVAAALSGMSEALLDLKVEPFLRAVDGMGGVAGGERRSRDLPPDARLRDIAGPKAADMPRELARETPRMMGAMAGMAGALQDMLPQLRAMGERMKDAVPRDR